eukprot:1226372-Pyramimonas_sp.AAC.1
MAKLPQLPAVVASSTNRRAPVDGNYYNDGGGDANSLAHDYEIEDTRFKSTAEYEEYEEIDLALLDADDDNDMDAEYEEEVEGVEFVLDSYFADDEVEASNNDNNNNNGMGSRRSTSKSTGVNDEL